MKKLILLVASVWSISGQAADIPGEVPCGDSPAMKKAQALVTKTTTALQKNMDKVVKEINDKSPEWRDGDLYVFGFEKGKCYTHGYNVSLIGQDLYNTKTKDGVEYVKGMYLIATSKGTGCIKYQWPNPAKNGKLEEKISYISKVKDDRWIGVGYYP